ncbi:hypothetical protein H6P81_008887 [Aristolochia fimbriata]|uniref:Uncharacterized protein n=1 Tax=Aristolochia fimbriata TaxID=158543 RepID=A0AAV7EMI2_ARIFI|nr:hypothetical protein H6P81_008887 [Aristolochia fimbriata]
MDGVTRSRCRREGLEHGDPINSLCSLLCRVKRSRSSMMAPKNLKIVAGRHCNRTSLSPRTANWIKILVRGGPPLSIRLRHKSVIRLADVSKRVDQSLSATCRISGGLAGGAGRKVFPRPLVRFENGTDHVLTRREDNVLHALTHQADPFFRRGCSIPFSAAIRPATGSHMGLGIILIDIRFISSLNSRLSFRFHLPFDTIHISSSNPQLTLLSRFCFTACSYRVNAVAAVRLLY